MTTSETSVYTITIIMLYRTVEESNGTISSNLRNTSNNLPVRLVCVNV
jgi:hypothetical protein